MKNLFLVALLLITHFTFGQAPEKLSFQAVVRDGSNTLVTNSNVGIQITILQGSMSGTPVFVEEHSATTNENGLVTIEIANGSVTSGVFADIDWGNGPFYIKTEIDPTGGTNYTILTNVQLLSVPYALYANKADTAAVALTVTTDRVYAYLKKKATIQNVVSGSDVTIVDYDTLDAVGFGFDNPNGTLTFNNDGVYIITVHTSFDAFGNPGRKNIWLDCNCALWPDRIAANETASEANRITTTFVGEFRVGDQISLSVFQNTGVTLDCPSNTLPFDQTWINIERLSDL